jgi:predicted PurR-regulated permease PerM
VALALLVIEEIEGKIVYPMVMSSAVAVHPFVSLLALILFSAMFGLLGAILAIPIVLAIQTAFHVFWIEEQLGSQDDAIDPVVSDRRA